MQPHQFIEASGPVRRAGLKHALLHDWQRGFPVERTPFRHVARRLGSTVREVLDQCQLLDAEGFGADIGVHWSEDMRMSRWRLWTNQPCGDAKLVLASCLACVPGLTVWHEREQVLCGADESQRPPAPRVWFDLMAREDLVAEAQITALLEALPDLPWSVVPARPDVPAGPVVCACRAGAGPCEDQPLARLCERGLPVVSRPYLAAAHALDRSEREVLLALKRWQNDGRLAHVSLAPRPIQSQSLHTAAVIWGPALDPGTRWKLMRWPGISNLHEWPGGGGPALVTTAWLPGTGENLLRRALDASGVPRQSYDLWSVRSHHVRDDPLLFADEDLPA